MLSKIKKHFTSYRFKQDSKLLFSDGLSFFVFLILTPIRLIKIIIEQIKAPKSKQK